MWNSLPHSVRRAPRVEIFKRSVRDILIRNLRFVTCHLILFVLHGNPIYYRIFIALQLQLYLKKLQQNTTQKGLIRK